MSLHGHTELLNGLGQVRQLPLDDADPAGGLPPIDAGRSTAEFVVSVLREEMLSTSFVRAASDRGPDQITVVLTLALRSDLDAGPRVQ